MARIYKIHSRFREYFGSDYQNKDVGLVCYHLLKLMKLPTQNSVEQVKKHWGQVCSYLILWQGERKKKHH